MKLFRFDFSTSFVIDDRVCKILSSLFEMLIRLTSGISNEHFFNTGDDNDTRTRNRSYKVVPTRVARFLLVQNTKTGK
jgi:hypothetical protein